MNPLADHPSSPLAHYIARQSWLNAMSKEARKDPPRSVEPRDSQRREEFLGALAELRDAYQDRLAEEARGENKNQPGGGFFSVPSSAKAGGLPRDAQWHIDGLLDYAQRCPSPYLAWAALERVPQWIGQLHGDRRAAANLALAAQYGRLERSPLAYAAQLRASGLL